MGRPPVKEAKQQYTVMLKPTIVKEIDEYAAKYNLTRSQLMGNLVESGLDDMKMLDKAGVIPMIYHGSNILKKFKEKLFNGKVSIDKKGEIKIEK